MLKLVPVLLVFVGLAGGVGAGILLKPSPEPEPDPEVVACTPTEEAPCPEPETHAAAGADAGGQADKEHGDKATGPEYVVLDKPFVVPVFSDQRVAAMVVLSVSVEVPAGGSESVHSLQPRLRDSFLSVLFRHANSGGFDGSFTTGEKMQDLKSALLAAAREVLGTSVGRILITEIVRQEV